MRNKEQKVVITFLNTTSAMSMEKLCKEQGLSGRLIPVPRCITAGCGLAFSANPQMKTELEVFMKESDICFDKIYVIEI